MGKFNVDAEVAMRKHPNDLEHVQKLLESSKLSVSHMPKSPILEAFSVKGLVLKQRETELTRNGPNKLVRTKYSLPEDFRLSVKMAYDRLVDEQNAAKQ
jgi:tRNA A37 N6-isopentenylltransferase MiaA